jgi:hypothetical protein
MCTITSVGNGGLPPGDRSGCDAAWPTEVVKGFEINSRNYIIAKYNV